MTFLRTQVWWFLLNFHTAVHQLGCNSWYLGSSQSAKLLRRLPSGTDSAASWHRRKCLFSGSIISPRRRVAFGWIRVFVGWPAPPKFALLPGNCRFLLGFCFFNIRRSSWYLMGIPPFANCGPRWWPKFQPQLSLVKSKLMQLPLNVFSPGYILNFKMKCSGRYS